MKDTQTTSFNGYFEHSERQEKLAQPFEAKHYTPKTSEDQIMLDYLMNVGFVWEEAVMLLHLREHLYENAQDAPTDD